MMGQIYWTIGDHAVFFGTLCLGIFIGRNQLQCKS